MPIRPENRDRYPDNWPAISRSIRFDRAGGRCECLGECGRGTHDGRCPNEHGGAAYGTGSEVVLTTAHLNHQPEDCRPENLRAMCQGCHLHHDRDHHRQTRAETRRRAAENAGQLVLGTPVYTLPSSPSWHTSLTCRALDTARLRTRSVPVESTDTGGRPACLVCADPGRDEWTLTTRNLWELWELVEPSKPYTEWDAAAGRPLVVGLTIREHHGLPRVVARYGQIIRRRGGRYTVHPAPFSGDPR